MISNVAFHTRGVSDFIDPTDKEKEILRMTVALEQSRVARARQQALALRGGTEDPVQGSVVPSGFVYRPSGRPYSERKEEEGDDDDDDDSARNDWMSCSLGVASSALEIDPSELLLPLPETKSNKQKRTHKRKKGPTSLSIQVGYTDEEPPTQEAEDRYREYVESMRVPKSKWKSAQQEASTLQSFNLSNSEVISTDIQVQLGYAYSLLLCPNNMALIFTPSVLCTCRPLHSYQNAMNTAIHTVEAKCPIAHAYSLFCTMGMRHLIVLDLDGVVVGVVTRKDLCHLPHIHGHAPKDASQVHGSNERLTGRHSRGSVRSSYFKGMRSSLTGGAGDSNGAGYVSFNPKNRSPSPRVLGWNRQRANSNPSALPSWLEDRGEVATEDRKSAFGLAGKASKA
jgi:hypothetical protein